MERFLADLDVSGVGEEVGWAKGFAQFFRMSLGGAAIGIAFGFGLLIILYLLNRRFNREENVVEVTSTIAVAYTNYYVAELVCHTCKLDLALDIVMASIVSLFMPIHFSFYPTVN